MRFGVIGAVKAEQAQADAVASAVGKVLFDVHRAHLFSGFMQVASR